MNNELPLIIECVTAQEANELDKSNKYRLERYSETRNCYIMIRRAR